MHSDLKALSAQIASCMLRDQHRLRRQLRNITSRHQSGKPVDRMLSKLEAEITRSSNQYQQRLKQKPVPAFPAELPVSEKRLEIADAIVKHQVVIVCGETGSGKTTQLPKICLELGRGVAGMIGHTQPRRIAARSVAARIAEELNTELGSVVGYKVRFSDKLGPNAYIKLMTDGILLAEMQEDRFLTQYDTIIIDEAHERSLNIDFLLGCLKQLLPKRPDLKVIITSATIDPQSFAKHFDNAPIVEVSGRTYPVEVHYRPVAGESEDEQDRDVQQAILDAIDEVYSIGLGDTLIFLPGERQIRETAEALRKHHPTKTEILPLYARLSTAEQNKVFASHIGPRIVLATNVAETSLTVPGIRYVIDTGYARISRYSYRTKVQRLPIEKVSRASADQRKGRCGRISSGVCVRLYDEDDFLDRQDYTDPEILRTNLASVILQMKALRLGDIEHFPFINAPDIRLINDGYKLLEELGAIDERRELNKLGKQLARLPIDPRIGRMILAAKQFNCLNEVLMIASALSVQDPRERPLDKQQKADEAHQRFLDEGSDFLAFVNLWQFFDQQRKHLSQNKLRKLCQQNFLSFVRMREWREIHSQLLSLVNDMGFKLNQVEAQYNEIHQALLSGLLANIGFKTEEYDYTGARNVKFNIFPGSGLFNKRPKWIMAGELMETAKLYGHYVAKIDPKWVESLAAHLIKHHYFEPHWEVRAARVAAYERTTLYGLTLTAKRKINYGPIDPQLSREIFIRSALVEGRYRTQAAFFKHNRALIEEIESLEHKSRRQDILADEQMVYEFYEDRVPEGIYSGAQFEKWRKQAERGNPHLLFLTRDYLMRHAAEEVTEQRFPPSINIAGIDLPLEYHFEPGDPKDGVTLIVPLAVLNQLTPERFEWLVPGLLHEKIVQLIKSLPKSLRRNFVPAPDFADACIKAMVPGETSLLDELTSQLNRMTGVAIARDAWRLELLPKHLVMNFKIVDIEGKQLAMGRDLETLQQQYGHLAAESFSGARKWGIERDNIKGWDFGEIPDQVEMQTNQLTIRGYPALVDEQTSVSLVVFDVQDKAVAAMRQGLRRLFMLQLGQQVKYLRKNLPNMEKMCLCYASIGSCEDLKESLVLAAMDKVFLENKPPIHSRSEFLARVEQGKKEMITAANAYCELVHEILQGYHELSQKLRGSIKPAWIDAIKDIQEQLQHLVHKNFVNKTPYTWLEQYPRYLKAIMVRLNKLDRSHEKDRQYTAQIKRLWSAYLERSKKHQQKSIIDPELDTYRWMIEELRLSLFAQELKTLMPVSVKRLESQLDKVK